jgi:hypothetical protein
VDSRKVQITLVNVTRSLDILKCLGVCLKPLNPSLQVSESQLKSCFESSNPPDAQLNLFQSTGSTIIPSTDHNPPRSTTSTPQRLNNHKPSPLYFIHLKFHLHLAKNSSIRSLFRDVNYEQISFYLQAATSSFCAVN